MRTASSGRCGALAWGCGTGVARELTPRDREIAAALQVKEVVDKLLALGGTPMPMTQPVNGSLWEMERELIFKTLAKVKDNRTHAAKELGISRVTLYNKIRKYQLRRDGEETAQELFAFLHRPLLG